MEMEAKVEGYISIGFTEESRQGAMDVVLGWVDDAGQGHVLDTHFDSYGGFTHSALKRDDSQKGLNLVSSSVTVVADGRNGAGRDGTYTSITFRREYNPDDDLGNRFLDPSEAHGVGWATNKKVKPIVADNVFQVATHYPSYKGAGNLGQWTIRLDDSDSATTCKNYCDVLMNACGDTEEAERQYVSQDVCRGLCALYTGELSGDASAFPVGTLADQDVNTLACRINHAHQAENAITDAMRQELCDVAGPLGGGVCGSYCENYCAFATDACLDPEGDDSYGLGFTSTATCMSACALLDNAGHTLSRVVDVNRGAPGFELYDTVQCRASHASLAYDIRSWSRNPQVDMAKPALRCPDARSIACRPDGDGPKPCSKHCSDDAEPTCALYCLRVTEACVGARAQFAGYPECMDWCAAKGDTSFRRGSLDDKTGNTLGCRLFLAANRAGTLLTCQDAKSGGNTCVDEPGPLAPSVPAGPPTSGHTWHIHTDVPVVGDCASAGGHYDPTGVEVEGYRCTEEDRENRRCYVGDLSGKHGTVSADGLARGALDVQLTMPELRNRSVVVHAAEGGAGRVACGAVVAGPPSAYASVAVGDVSGRIVFTRRADGATEISATLEHKQTPAGGSAGHAWKLCTSASPGKPPCPGEFAAPACLQVVGSAPGPCDPDTQSSCAAGDLTAKFGTLSTDGVERFYVDTVVGVPVAGDAALVLYGANDSKTALACTPIASGAPEGFTDVSSHAVLSGAEYQGVVTFSQAGSRGVLVSVGLSVLPGNATAAPTLKTTTTSWLPTTTTTSSARKTDPPESTTPPATLPANSPEPAASGSSAGAVAGGIVGAVVGVGLVVAFAVVLRRSKGSASPGQQIGWDDRLFDADQEA